jgi:hypothetical protein
MKYSPEEITFLERWYALRGPKWCAARLNRKPETVHAKAKKLGLTFGDVPGWVRTIHLANAIGVGNTTVYNAASAQGVLRVVGTGAKAALVPEKWADAYLKKYEAWAEGEQARAAGYLTTGEARAVLSIGKSTILRAISQAPESYLAPYFRHVRSVRGYRGRLLLNPHDIETVRKQLEAQRWTEFDL